MKAHRKAAKMAGLIALALVAVAFTLVKNSMATGTITKADLSGPWQLTMYSQNGCGVGTSLVTFNLNAGGTGTATIKSHSAGCGDATSTGNTFTISTLGSTGSGTAGLSCGVGCGYALSIQVSADRSTFNVVDLTDPNNFLEGVAIHQ